MMQRKESSKNQMITNCQHKNIKFKLTNKIQNYMKKYKNKLNNSTTNILIFINFGRKIMKKIKSMPTFEINILVKTMGQSNCRKYHNRLPSVLE